jgi:hypothetical protein
VNLANLHNVVHSCGSGSQDSWARGVIYVTRIRVPLAGVGLDYQA